jgi:hypothetical protein
MTYHRRWSNSSLQTLQRCGHQWYLKYVKKMWRDSGPAAKRGIAVHHVAKEAHKLQMSISDLWTGSTPELEEVPGSPKSREEAEQLALEVFDEQWRRGVKLNKKEMEVGMKLVKEQHRQVAIDLSGFYNETVAPTVSPVGVERKIEIESKKLDATLVGYLDLIEDDEGKEYIRDLKSAEKKPWGFEEDEEASTDDIKVGRSKPADDSSQLTLYALIRWSETKKISDGQRLVTVSRTPSKGLTTAYVAQTQRDMDDIRILGRRIKTAIEATEKGVFVPADPGAAGSPCSWCEFAEDGTCEYVRSGAKHHEAQAKLPLSPPKRYFDLKKKDE